MAMSDVAATGMEQLYPGGVQVRVCYIPSCTLIGDTCRYRRGQTLYSSLTGAFLRPRTEDKQRWKPAFCVCVVNNNHDLLGHTASVLRN